MVNGLDAGGAVGDGDADALGELGLAIADGNQDVACTAVATGSGTDDRARHGRG